MMMNNLSKTFVFFIIASLGMLCSGYAQCRILTIGDSTMASYDENTNELRGWVQMLPPFLNNDVTLNNQGASGRSSKSFYHEFWVGLRASLKPGDYVFIQFGHNDEKSAGLDSKDQLGLGTAAWGQYIEYLTKYVQECRDRGAIPILFTSVVRGIRDDNRKLTDESLHSLSKICGNNIQMNYPLAMRALAIELDVPLIDMRSLTQQLVEFYEYEKSKRYIYCRRDDAHLQATGGMLFAGLAVNELQKKGLLTKELIPLY